MDTTSTAKEPNHATVANPVASTARINPTLRVVGLVVAIVSVTLALIATTPEWLSVDRSDWPTLVALAVAFAVSERVILHIEARAEAVSYSPSDAVLAVGIAFFGPAGVIGARLVGETIATTIMRQPTPLKRLFNGANHAMETAIAFALYRAMLGAPTTPNPMSWFALLVSLYAALVAAALTVEAAVSCFEGDFMSRAVTELRRSHLMHLPGAVLGAAIATSMRVHLWLGLTTGALVPVIWLVVRSHGALQHRYTDLTNVQGFSDEVGDATDVTAVIAAGAAQIADNLRAATVAVRVWDRDGVHTDMVIGDERTVAALPATAPELASDFETGDDDPQGSSDASGALSLSMRLVDERGPFGVVRVSDRVGIATCFDRDDEDRLATMVTQLGIAVRKSQLHTQVQFDATHDRLTTLANRGYFEAWVDEATTAGQPGVVLFADLDGFKEINDAFGHHAGDGLLRVAAGRIAGLTPAGGLSARFGGDEFALFAPGLTLDEAEGLATAIADALDEPFALPEATVSVASSIGISRCPDHGSSSTTLLRRADTAMYHAKRSARRFTLYSAGIDEDDSLRLALLADLRQALTGNQLDVHFQPKIDIATGKLVAAEALVRWTHPERGPISPDVFVELAQQASLIEQLTDVVMDRSTRAAAQWHRRGWALSVAINISAQSLLDERLIEMVEHHLADKALDGSAVTLEITESTMMGDPDRTHRMLHRLTALGVEIAVDDFGTGYSSLSSLRSLPVTELKIDRGFVAAMSTSHHDAVIVRSTIELAHNLGLRIVAEGVETPEVLRDLGNLDCDLAQGFGISAPLPLQRFNEWAQQRLLVEPRPTWEWPSGFWTPQQRPRAQADSKSANNSSNAVI